MSLLTDFFVSVELILISMTFNLDFKLYVR